MKSLASEMGLRGEKRFSVTTLLNCKLLENDFTCILQGKSKCMHTRLTNNDKLSIKILLTLYV